MFIEVTCDFILPMNVFSGGDGGGPAGGGSQIPSRLIDCFQCLHNSAGGRPSLCLDDQHMYPAKPGGREQRPQPQLNKGVATRADALPHRAGLGLLHRHRHPPLSCRGGSSLLGEVPPSEE